LNSHPDFINPIAPAALEISSFQGGFFFRGLEIYGETVYRINRLMRHLEPIPNVILSVVKDLC
jgi:hypothetical protein